MYLIGYNLSRRCRIQATFRFGLQTVRRCAGGAGRTRISILGMFSATALSPPSSARCAGLSPMWRRHRAATMTPRFRHTHRVVRAHDPSRQAGLRKQKTWAVISLAAGVRGAAGERHGTRNPDRTARRRLLAARCCSHVSSSLAWRRKRHWRT